MREKRCIIKPNKSVPPVEPGDAITIPKPIPVKTPPKTAAKKISSPTILVIGIKYKAIVRLIKPTKVFFKNLPPLIKKPL